MSLDRLFTGPNCPEIKLCEIMLLEDQRRVLKAERWRKAYSGRSHFLRESFFSAKPPHQDFSVRMNEPFKRMAAGDEGGLIITGAVYQACMDPGV